MVWAACGESFPHTAEFITMHEGEISPPKGEWNTLNSLRFRLNLLKKTFFIPLMEQV